MKNKNNKNNYYIGLDPGDAFLGWAVTEANESYALLKHNKKTMWGVRAFGTASTAEDRRLHRSSRRRTHRTKNRISLLQKFFESEVNKVDPSFFKRLNESNLYLKDKSTSDKHVLFADDNYCDIDFHKDYPTFYHLRKALIENNAPHDIRLVYLALAHIMKNRGHFLVEGNLSNVKDLSLILNQFVNSYFYHFNDKIEIDENQFKKVLADKKINKTTKQNRLSALIKYDDKSLDKDEKKVVKKRIKEICKIMIGSKGDLSKIFGEEIKAELGDALENKGKPTYSIEFSTKDYEEKILPQLENLIPDKVNMINTLQAFYNWMLLDEIMIGQECFSYAQIKRYQIHKKNLKALRAFLRKYLTHEEFEKFFHARNSDDANYCQYIGHVEINEKRYRVKRCGEEAFYGNLKSILKAIKESGVDKKDEKTLNWLFEKVNEQKLLPLQRSKDNSIVPRQLHEAELNAILCQAEKYFPFLLEKDASGLTVSDKIKSIFNFRIPYYVGPLGGKNDDPEHNHWLVRKKGKEDEMIYPWNFKEVVDEKKCNEKFITRMTNDCSYLQDEKVLPKNSLYYSKYMVLDEINNLKILGEEISVELKQEIYRDLFSVRTKVTYKQLTDYLKKKDSRFDNLDSSMIGGIDQERNDFKANLSPLATIKKIFGDNLTDERIAVSEDIIKWSTVYGDDTSMLLEILKEHYGDILTKEQLKTVEFIAFKDWGNFSEKFLMGIPGKNLETGECYDNILECMWETNDNLQQVLSDKYDFKKNIDRFNLKNSKQVNEFSYDALVKDLKTSPAIKRSIWQTLLVVREIVKVKKAAPEKIFIEMARGGNGNKERTISRRDKLETLISNSNSVNKNELLKELQQTSDRALKKNRVYLYFLQEGKCAYSGESIDLKTLCENSQVWDIDHIYPQSKVKDDSFDNIVVVRRDLNKRKGDGIVPEDIQEKMRSTWQRWIKLNYISKEKAYRLNRRLPLTPSELADFTNSQLVSTRQASKLIADILKKLYPNTKVVYVKAKHVANFRKDPLNMFKCRDINDLHHAKDAYLNIVVGNVYDTKFTSNPKAWFAKNKKFNIKKLYSNDIEGAWKKPTDYDQGTLTHVRKTMLQNDVLYTERTYCDSGEMYNATLQKKQDPDKAKKLLPLKKGLDPQKYGGYTSLKTSYFSLIEYTNNENNRVKKLIGVPVHVNNMMKYNPDAFKEYCNDLGMHDAVMTMKIKKNSLFIVDNYPMRIRGITGEKFDVKSNLQLVTTPETEEIIRLVKRWNKKKGESKREIKIDEQCDRLDSVSLDNTFNELIDILKSEKYKNRPANPYQRNLKKFVEENKFEKMSLEDKAKAINNLLEIFSCQPGQTADLKVIGGAKNSGKMSHSFDLNKSQITLINESVTGLFSKKVNLTL